MRDAWTTVVAVRTTLDIDDRVLALARSRARSAGVSIGRALSDLALRGYEAAEEQAGDPPSRGTFPVLPAVPGHLITDEMVDAALAEDG